MNRRGRKKNQNICSETAKNANFHFSHYKSMATISYHSNQRPYPIEKNKTKKTKKKTKNKKQTKKQKKQQQHNYSFPRPIDPICEVW